MVTKYQSLRIATAERCQSKERKMKQQKYVISFNQSHYIEFAQGVIFMEKKYDVWVDFGPVGNTEKKLGLL